MYAVKKKRAKARLSAMKRSKKARPTDGRAGGRTDGMRERWREFASCRESVVVPWLTPVTVVCGSFQMTMKLIQMLLPTSRDPHRQHYLLFLSFQHECLCERKVSRNRRATRVACLAHQSQKQTA